MNTNEVNTAREEVLKELLLRKQQRKKDWNKNIFSVRTNDEIAAKIKDHCKQNKIIHCVAFKIHCPLMNHS